jgi:hypothetical protein
MVELIGPQQDRHPVVRQGCSEDAFAEIRGRPLVDSLQHFAANPPLAMSIITIV